MYRNVFTPAFCALLVCAAVTTLGTEEEQVPRATAQPPVGLSQARPGPLPEEAKAVASASNEFALALYRAVTQPDENLFFSPFSISSALAMTYAGARGDTARQMAEALRLEVPAEEVHQAYKALLEDLNARSEGASYELVVANALWGQKGFGFLAQFLELTRAAYGAGLRELDFRTDPEAARQTINQWIEETTREKIRDLIPPGVIDPQTRLVLTNAIYFLGTWASQFEKEATEESPFTLADGTEVEAPLMHQRGRFRYMETDTFQALQMPYKGWDLSMVLFLPRTADGLAEFEKQLTHETLMGWVGELRPRKGDVWLPRFTITSTVMLADVLKEMGMTDAFSAQVADFSGMDGKRDLYVSQVIHKAFVDVDEEGTEAAAATAVIVRATAMPPREEKIFEFRADHPFLFIIGDRRSGAILFMGRVMDPR